MARDKPVKFKVLMTFVLPKMDQAEHDKIAATLSREFGWCAQGVQRDTDRRVVGTRIDAEGSIGALDVAMDAVRSVRIHLPRKAMPIRLTVDPLDGEG